MLIQERKETIKVLELTLKYLEKNLEHKIFLCYMQTYIGVPYKCGLTDRMIPNAKDYFQSQQPTASRNKEFYTTPYYNRKKEDRKEWSAWWDYPSSESPISTNMEKARFLKHLIQKLKR